MSNSDANAPLPDVPTAEREFREVNGVELHVVSAGSPTDPLVVLLHGFPEFWYGWSAYVPRFVEAGYRVVVPDQRGYNRSDKPDGIRPYRLPTLARDVVSLVGTEDRDAAHVVGHDWGGSVAWNVAMRHPEVVDRLGVVNMPHTSVYVEALRTNPAQQRKSRYVFAFQRPGEPEEEAKRSGFATWVAAMRGPSKPGTFTGTDFERYRRAWSEPGAPEAMINWYRALLQFDDDPPRERVDAPTLLVWGENDQALVPELAAESLDYCEDGALERFPDATHWVNHERPGRVAELLLDHLES